jgi:hypothetical protein
MAARAERRQRFIALRTVMRRLSAEDLLDGATDDEATLVYLLMHRHEEEDHDLPFQRRVADSLALVRTVPELMVRMKEGRPLPDDEELERGKDSESENQYRSGDRDHQRSRPKSPYDSHDHIYQTDEAQDQLAIVSGGVSLRDRVKRRPSSDHLLAEDTPQSLYEHMPFKILRRQDIAALDIFSDKDILEAMPDEWRTTVLGVARALQANEEVHGPESNDRTLLAHLAMRGGPVLKRGSVVYPEDIISIALQNDDREGGDPPRWMDPPYWEALLSQGDNMGEAWDTVFEDDYPAVL